VEFDNPPIQPPLVISLYRRSQAIPLVHRALASLAAIAGQQPIANPRAAELRAIERELKDLAVRLESLETALQITPETTEPELLQRRLDRVAAGLYAADPTLPTTETISLPADLLFTNEAVLDPTQRSLFDPIVERLTEFPEAVVYVASHTDHQGDREAERAFSFDRAAQILVYLRGRIDGAGYRWMAIGYGSTRPIVTEQDAIDRQRNRRIELKIKNLR
jgi:outer membrane protein OmpA-like peptidoglycan-associated protein